MQKDAKVASSKTKFEISQRSQAKVGIMRFASQKGRVLSLDLNGIKELTEHNEWGIEF